MAGGALVPRGNLLSFVSTQDRVARSGGMCEAGVRCGLALLGLICPGLQPPSPTAMLSTLEAVSNGK